MHGGIDTFQGNTGVNFNVKGGEIIYQLCLVKVENYKKEDNKHYKQLTIHDMCNSRYT